MEGRSAIEESGQIADERFDGSVLFLEDVAALLRVSRSTIERRRRRGTFPIPELPPLDRRPRWSRAEVRRFIESTHWTQPGRGRPSRRR